RLRSHARRVVRGRLCCPGPPNHFGITDFFGARRPGRRSPAWSDGRHDMSWPPVEWLPTPLRRTGQMGRPRVEEKVRSIRRRRSSASTSPPLTWYFDHVLSRTLDVVFHDDDCSFPSSRD